MRTKIHLSLWWSILCSSHGLSHLHCVLARSSAGAFELVCVTNVAMSRSCRTLSLCRSNCDSVPFRLVRGCSSFSDSKVNFLAFHVTYVLNAAAVVMLAAEVSFFRSHWHDENNRNSVPPPLLLVSLCNRDPKHQNRVATLVEVGPIPHFLRDSSLESAVREQNKVTERWRQQFKLRCVPPPRVKRWIPGAMPLWLYCVTEATALHQTHGSHLALLVAVMVPQTQGPPQEEMKGEEEKQKCWLLRNASVTKETEDGPLRDGHLCCGAHLLNTFYCFITMK